MSGPALPHESRTERHPWMSLRDWFAGQALAGMMARGGVVDTPTAFAEAAYGMADAMLKAREK